MFFSLKMLRLKRFYASIPTKMLVNFGVPHQSISKSEQRQVNISTTDGDMGILVGHVPSVLQLKPSVVELINDQESKKYFVSGGFAVMNPDSSLNINAVEACELDQLDVAAAKAALEEAKRVTGSEEEKATASIQIEVLEAVIKAAQ